MAFSERNERVEAKATSCPRDGKIPLKADEPQICQRHENVERKRIYYHIIILFERLEILHQERRGHDNEEKLQQHSILQVRT